MTKELDIACERALGGALDHPGFFWTEGSTPDGKDGWDGFMCPRCHADESQRGRPCARHFSTDPAATPLLLAEIERRGLRYEYVYALVREIDPSAINPRVDRGWNVPQLAVWQLLNATPEQHARAFIASIQSR